MANTFFRQTLALAFWLILGLVAGLPSADPEVIENESVLDQARILVEAGQPDSARDMIRTYLEGEGLRQNSDYAEYLLALTAFSDTDTESPWRAVEALRQKYPDSRYVPAALFRLGQFYRVSIRNPERAVAVYSQFVQSYPTHELSKDAYLWLASALIDSGQYDRAISAIHQAQTLYEYEAREKRIFTGLLDFARLSTGRLASSGVTIDVKPPPGAPELPPPEPSRTDLESPAGVGDAGAGRTLSPGAVDPAGIDAPDGRPVQPAPRPGSRAPEESGSAPEESVRESVKMEMLLEKSDSVVLMNYRDAEIDDVLNSLSEELGLTFIKDEEVQGKITVINPRPLRPIDALHLLESILEMKSFALVRSGTVLKILPAQKSYSRGLDLYPPDEQAPKTDRPVTKVIRLQHALAQDVSQVLQPLIGDQGLLQADVSKNSIVITGTASNVSRLTSIARLIDESGRTDQYEAFKLKFLSAAEALPLAQKLLATTQPEQLGALKLVAGPTPVYLFAVGPRQMMDRVRDVLRLIDVPGFKEESLNVYPLKQANAEKLSGFLETLLAKGLVAPSVEGVPSRPGVVSADRITNSIVVLGSRAFHDVISPLIEKLDYEGFSAFRVQVIPLKYAQAADLAPKFENIVARGLGPRGEAFSNQILIQADARLNALLIASVSQSLLKTMASLSAALDRPAEEGGPRTVVYYLENADASKLVTVLTDIFSKNDAPAVQPAKIVADKGTNSLVIVSMRENYDAVMETVMKLDIAPYQVLVEALILEVALDDATQLGVDWTLKKSNVDFDIRTAGTSLENLAFAGLKQAVVKDQNQLSGVIHALMTKTNTKVLATPRIFAANNQEASILIGDQVPVKTGTTTTTGGVTQNTFEYKDVGIKLKVTPHINRKKQTALDIVQEIKSIRPTSTSTENPTFQTREAKTSAILGDGQTVVLGGLIRTDRTKQTSEVPILGRIPLIGAAFRKVKDAEIRSELIIFISPNVIETESDMAAAIEAQKRTSEKAGFEPVRLDPDTPSRTNFIREFILK